MGSFLEVPGEEEAAAEDDDNKENEAEVLLQDKGTSVVHPSIFVCNGFSQLYDYYSYTDFHSNTFNDLLPSFLYRWTSNKYY